MSRRHAARPRLVVDNRSSSESWTPCSRAKRIKGKCQVPGTASRSRHLRLASSLTPSFSASGSIRSQKSMTGIMDKSSSLSSKTHWTNGDVTPEEAMAFNSAMSDTPKNFTQGFLDRTARARDATGMTQEEMGTALHIEPGTYPKYENRGPLPHCLIERFCLIARVQIAWLLSDKDESVSATPQSLKIKPRKKRKRRRQSKPDVLVHETKK